MKKRSDGIFDYPGDLLLFPAIGIGTAIRLGLELFRIEPEQVQGWDEGRAKARGQRQRNSVYIGNE